MGMFSFEQQVAQHRRNRGRVFGPEHQRAQYRLNKWRSDLANKIINSIREDKMKDQSTDQEFFDERYVGNRKPPKAEVRYGHPDFYRLLEEVAELHSDKNHDYAAGGSPLGNFERRANLYGMYPGLDLSDPVVVALVDSMKQLDAALWFKSNGHTAKVEGVEERLIDDAVYKLIAVVLEREKAKQEMDWDEFVDLHEDENDGEDEPGDPVNHIAIPNDPQMNPCTLGHDPVTLNCSGGWFWVFCSTCKRRGPHEQTSENAITKWNAGQQYNLSGHRVTRITI